MDTDRMRRDGEIWHRRFIRTALAAAAAVAFSLAGVSAACAEEDPRATVYKYIVDEMDLSPAAACGIMGNMQAESNFNAGISGASGFGLCQWTGVRTSRLHAFCASNKLDSTSPEGQVAFIHYELKNFFPHVYASLLSVSNDAAGAYSAAYTFCVGFEVPANAHAMGVYRGSLASNIYWPSYGEVMLYLKAAPSANGIELSWSGKVAEKQVIMRAKKKDGKFERIATVGKKDRTYLDRSVRKQKQYFYYVCPESEYKKYVKKNQDPPNRSNKYEVTSVKSMGDDECIIELSRREYVYSGKEKKPKVTIRYAGRKLKSGRDYKVSYQNNLNAGRAYVIVRGIGNYAGTARRSFRIHRAPLKARVRNIAARLGTEDVEPVVTIRGVKNPQVKLISSSDPSVASIRENRIILKKKGVTFIKVRIFGDRNHGILHREFRLRVKKAAARKEDTRS